MPSLLMSDGGKVAAMKRKKLAKRPASLNGPRRPQKARKPASGRRRLGRLVSEQKRALLSVAGIGASGFSDISAQHDTYLYEKP